MCVYRPPKMQDSEFGQEFKNTLDKCVSLFDRYMVIGDLNYDLLCETKGKPLLNIMELFNLSNLISKPTCFMKNSKPSLLDVILTNSKTQCIRTLNFATGISDCHNIISTVINNQIPINEKQRIQYRSYKSIDIDALNDEIKEIKLIGNITDENLDINSIYDQFESDLRNVFDKHAPIKERYVRNNQVPYMNRTLRKAIYNKKKCSITNTLKIKTLNHGKNTGSVGI